MTQAEFQAILDDVTKQILCDILWSEDEDHSPTLEFRQEIHSQAGYPIFAHGSYNPMVNKLSYVIIHRSSGCIYRLDMGSDHHNPSCNNVGGDRHIHIWNELTRDKEAIYADQITANADDPATVWQQFCALFNIAHLGMMQPPPEIGLEVFL